MLLIYLTNAKKWNNIENFDLIGLTETQVDKKMADDEKQTTKRLYMEIHMHKEGTYKRKGKRWNYNSNYNKKI